MMLNLSVTTKDPTYLTNLRKLNKARDILPPELKIYLLQSYSNQDSIDIFKKTCIPMEHNIKSRNKSVYLQPTDF